MTDFNYWYEVSNRNSNRTIEYAGIIGVYNALLSSTINKLRSAQGNSHVEYIEDIEKRQEDLENHFDELVSSHKKKETSLT